MRTNINKKCFANTSAAPVMFIAWVDFKEMSIRFQQQKSIGEYFWNDSEVRFRKVARPVKADNVSIFVSDDPEAAFLAVVYQLEEAWKPQFEPRSLEIAEARYQQLVQRHMNKKAGK